MTLKHSFLLLFFLPAIAPAHAQTAIDTTRFHVMRVLITTGLSDYREVQISTVYPLDKKVKNDLLQTAYRSRRDLEPLKEKAQKEGWAFVESYGQSDSGLSQFVIVFQKGK